MSRKADPGLLPLTILSFSTTDDVALLHLPRSFLLPTVIVYKEGEKQLH